MIQQAGVEINPFGGEQGAFFPIRIAPVDSHQAAVLEFGLFEARAGELDQAQVAFFEGAALEAAFLEGALAERTIRKAARLEADLLDGFARGIKMLKGLLSIGGLVKWGHGMPFLEGEGQRQYRLVKKV